MVKKSLALLGIGAIAGVALHYLLKRRAAVWYGARETVRKDVLERAVKRGDMDARLVQHTMYDWAPGDEASDPEWSSEVHIGRSPWRKHGGLGGVIYIPHSMFQASNRYAYAKKNEDGTIDLGDNFTSYVLRYKPGKEPVPAKKKPVKIPEWQPGKTFNRGKLQRDIEAGLIEARAFRVNFKPVDGGWHIAIVGDVGLDYREKIDEHGNILIPHRLLRDKYSYKIRWAPKVPDIIVMSGLGDSIHLRYMKEGAPAYSEELILHAGGVEEIMFSAKISNWGHWVDAGAEGQCDLAYLLKNNLLIPHYAPRFAASGRSRPRKAWFMDMHNGSGGWEVTRDIYNHAVEELGKKDEWDWRQEGRIHSNLNEADEEIEHMAAEGRIGYPKKISGGYVIVSVRPSGRPVSKPEYSEEIILHSPELRYASESLVREFEDNWDWNSIARYSNMSDTFIREFENKWNWDILSRNKRLSENILREFKDKWDWDSITRYSKMSNAFIREFKDKWNWSHLSRNEHLSENIIREFENRWDWRELSKNEHLSESILREFKDKWDWRWIAQFSSMPDAFIREFKDKWDWNELSQNEHLSENIIREFENKWNWDGIARYSNMSDAFIREFKDRWDWNELSLNKHLSKDIIREFENKWNWDWIARYSNMPDALIREFKDRWEWDDISYNKHLSENIIREFKDKWDWEWIAQYSSMSDTFIREFKDKWNWDNLSQNEHLFDNEPEGVYSEELILHARTPSIDMPGYSADKSLVRGSIKQAALGVLWEKQKKHPGDPWLTANVISSRIGAHKQSSRYLNMQTGLKKMAEDGILMRRKCSVWSIGSGFEYAIRPKLEIGEEVTSINEGHGRIIDKYVQADAGENYDIYLIKLDSNEKEFYRQAWVLKSRISQAEYSEELILHSPGQRYASESFVREHIDDWNWKGIAQYSNMPDAFIRESKDKWNWEYLSPNKHLSENILREFKDNWEWDDIAQFSSMSDAFIREFMDKWNWSYLSRNEYLSENILHEFEDKWNWDSIAQHSNMSDAFICEFKDKWNWLYLSYNDHLSENIIREFEDKWDWTGIAWHSNMSDTFIHEFKDKWNWNSLSRNEHLSENILREFKDKWDWDWIALHSNMPDAFIHEFKDKWKWDYLSRNGHLSENIIREFEDKWEWNEIAHRSNMSDAFIREFMDKWSWEYLSMNKRLFNNEPEGVYSEELILHATNKNTLPTGLVGKDIKIYNKKLGLLVDIDRLKTIDKKKRSAIIVSNKKSEWMDKENSRSYPLRSYRLVLDKDMDKGEYSEELILHAVRKKTRETIGEVVGVGRVKAYKRGWTPAYKYFLAVKERDSDEERKIMVTQYKTAKVGFDQFKQVEIPGRPEPPWRGDIVRYTSLPPRNGWEAVTPTQTIEILAKSWEEYDRQSREYSEDIILHAGEVKNG